MPYRLGQNGEKIEVGVGGSSPTSMGGANISPEMAMFSQIFLPQNQSSKVKSAFDIQQAQISRQEDLAEKKAKEEEPKKAIRGFVDVANELKQQAQDITVPEAALGRVGIKLGLDPQIKQFDSKKALLGQFLAKMVENGRLSDKDREFYLNQILNISPVGPQGAKERLLEGIVSDVVRLSGFDPEEFDISGGTTADKKKDKTAGQFLKNFKEDVSGIAQGIAAIPGIMSRVPQQLRAIPQVAKGVQEGQISPQEVQQQVGQGLTQVVQPTIEEYSRLLTEPGEAFYEKPVSQALNVLPFLAAAKKISSVGRAGKTADVVGDVSKVAKGAEEASAITKVTTSSDDLTKILTKTTAAGEPAEEAVNLAGRIFNQQFTVPSKIANRMNPLEVSKEIVKHGFAPGSFEDMAAVAGKVTGESGEVTKMVRRALSNTTSPLDINDAIKVADNIRTPAVKPNMLLQQKQTINEILGSRQGQLPSTMNAMDAMDAIRELEDLGYQFLASDTPLSPNVANRQISKMYLETADELSMSLNKSAVGDDAINALKTPENISILQGISPRLAKQFVEAKSLKDLRSIQAPFVKWQQMMKLTENAAQTPFSKLADVGSKTIATGAGGLVGGLPGALAGFAASPLLEGILEANIPKLQQLLAQGARKAGQANIPPQLKNVLGL